MGVSPFQGPLLGWLLRRLEHQIDTAPRGTTPGNDGQGGDKRTDAGANGLPPYSYPRDDPMPPRRLGWGRGRKTR